MSIVLYWLIMLMSILWCFISALPIGCTNEDRRIVANLMELIYCG